MMVAQAVVVGIGAITLVVTATLVAPGLFHEHLTHVGVDAPEVQAHAEEAFASAFAISVAVATGSALMAAGLRVVVPGATGLAACRGTCCSRPRGRGRRLRRERARRHLQPRTARVV